MSAILISRIIGALVLGIIGAFTSLPIYSYVQQFVEVLSLSQGVVTGLSAVIFAGFGFLITPYITIKPFQSLMKLFTKSPVQSLMSGLLGMTIGLIIAAIMAYPLSLLPKPFGQIFPLVGLLLFSYLGGVLFVTRRDDFENFFKNRGSKTPSRAKGESERRVLVDTSAIIDGRIADIARTGFLGATLVVPRFVLNELQFVSDSADSLRRQRGRRGLDVLGELQESKEVNVVISDIDVEGVREVDDRLVLLGRQMNCPILTNDFNLNRVAELQGVKVLNINDLANAVKVVILPGESLQIEVLQEGKEYNQGVGYLDDGTMVVIENGQRYIDKKIDVTVTKILQTSAGRMIFAKPTHE
ncbi:MAG: TRAM domain-containing protein [Anaerolineaceae bacterium]|nr:TRAM domain-containing protein [Anaerolineaceae bacterium]